MRDRLSDFPPDDPDDGWAFLYRRSGKPSDSQPDQLRDVAESPTSGLGPERSDNVDLG